MGKGLGLPILLTFSLFLFPSILRAQSALILIQHDEAGPNLPSGDYFYAEWIRWPKDQPSLNNRILSLATGLDLHAERGDTGFKALANGAWQTTNGASLQNRGFFAARRAYLGNTAVFALRHEPGNVSPSVLLVALEDPDRPVRTLPHDANVPSGALVVAEARNWDEAALLARRVSGRTLIVEYPPADEDAWSRYWTRGKGWPDGVPTERDLGIPGLVRGSRALDLLLRPDGFRWRPNDAGRWGGPNRWLEHGYGTTPGILLAWFVLGALVVGWAFAQVMNEDRGPFVSELLVILALSPIALVASGAAAALGGLESWPIVLTLVWAALYAVAWALSFVLRRYVPEAHPLWAPCAVGLVGMVVCDPLWSDFSGRFGPLELDVPGQALGALLAYATGVVAFARGRWLGRTVVAALLIAGVTAHPWWIGGHASLLLVPALALVAAEGLFRPGLLLLLALLPTGLFRIARDGLAWNPDGLLDFDDQRAALNLWRTTLLILSPAWLGSLAVLATGLLVGNRFLAYRLRKLLRGDPRLRALPWATAGILALGVTEPLALPAVPVVAFGALIALAYDGLRANA